MSTSEKAAKPSILHGKEYGTLFLVAGILLPTTVGVATAPVAIPMLLAGLGLPLLEAQILRANEQSLERREAGRAAALVAALERQQREDGKVYHLYSSWYRRYLERRVVLRELDPVARRVLFPSSN